MNHFLKPRREIFLLLLVCAELAAEEHAGPGQSASAPPQVRITQLRRFDQNMPLAPLPQNLTVRHYENHLEIAFQVQAAPEGDLIFCHRLLGVDTGWVETRQNFVQYKNLDNGKYTFEVKAAHAGGNWGQPASISFALQPPFWERLWFVFFIALLTFGSAAYLITFRIRQLLAIERLRARIAADLHDNIGAGLTEISILSEIGAQNMTPAAANGVVEHFSKISHLSRALAQSMNDIVWLVNPKKDSLHDLIQQLGGAFEDVSLCNGTVFRTRNLEIMQEVHLPMEYRLQLYHLFKEALHNSLKHSAAREVVLEASARGRQLLLRLRDDGRGFDPAQVKSGNGLENMQHRAEVIGGKLAIHSAIGEGTVIEFSGKISPGQHS